MNTNRILVGALIGAAGMLSLSACVVAPVDHGYYVGDPVYVAPPAVRYEYVGLPPVTGYVWVSGYWDWVKDHHVWRPGRWQPPRPGAVWVPHRWERDGSRWRLHDGHWRAQ